MTIENQNSWEQIKSKETKVIADIKNLVFELIEYQKKGVFSKYVMNNTIIFENLVPRYNKTLTLINKVNTVKLITLPLDVLREIKIVLREFVECIMKIGNYNVEQSQINASINNKDAIQKLIMDFSTCTTNVYSVYGKYISLLIFDKFENDIDISDINTSREKIFKIEDDTNKIFETIKDNMSEKTISIYKGLFQEQAKNFNKFSKCWMAGIFSTIILLIVLIIWSFSKIGTSDLFEIIKSSIPRVLIFSLLYYLLIWIGRNYNNQKHNAIIYKQKELALETFELFINSTRSDEVKDAILIQVSNAIFSTQSTGYLKGNVNPPALNILDIAKTVMKEK